MQEHGAAPPCDARPGIVVDLDDEIVEMILPRQTITILAGQALDRAVVVPIGGIFRPSVGRTDRPDRQIGLRPGVPVGAPPQPHRPEAAAGCSAVAFELVGLDSAASKRDR